MAKRIVSELDVRDLIRSTRSERNRVLLAVMYATGLRVSEIVALNIADVIQRQDGRVQMHIVGKGGKERDVLVPQSLGTALLQVCGGRAATGTGAARAEAVGGSPSGRSITWSKISPTALASIPGFRPTGCATPTPRIAWIAARQSSPARSGMPTSAPPALTSTRSPGASSRGRPRPQSLGLIFGALPSVNSASACQP